MPACHPCVTTAQLPPRLGFADPGKSIAAVCRWPARGEETGTGEREGLRRGGDGEGAGAPQGHEERQQDHVVGEGLDGEDPEALVSHLGVWRIPPEDAAPSSRPGEPRLLPEPMESTETLPNADR